MRHTVAPLPGFASTICACGQAGTGAQSHYSCSRLGQAKESEIAEPQAPGIGTLRLMNTVQGPSCSDVIPPRPQKLGAEGSGPTPCRTSYMMEVTTTLIEGAFPSMVQQPSGRMPHHSERYSPTQQSLPGVAGAPVKNKGRCLTVRQRPLNNEFPLSRK